MKYFKNTEYPEIQYNSTSIIDEDKELKVTSKEDIVEVPDELYEEYSNIKTLIPIEESTKKSKKESKEEEKDVKKAEEKVKEDSEDEEHYEEEEGKKGFFKKSKKGDKK